MNRDRACIQLYHHVATQVELCGKNVLEVSCGHGGGASYLTRTLQPKSYTALDLNPTGINFCRQRHRIEGLNFVQGDAENLPFESNSFDAVINVEASHCYPDLRNFWRRWRGCCGRADIFSMPTSGSANAGGMGPGAGRIAVKAFAYPKHQCRSSARHGPEFPSLRRLDRAASAGIPAQLGRGFCRRQRLAHSQRPQGRRAFLSFILF